MRDVTLYLRRGKVLLVAMGGGGGLYYESGQARMCEPEVEELATALEAALPESLIPSRAPDDLHLRPTVFLSFLGLTQWSEFMKGTKASATLQELDDRYEVNQGTRIRGGWRAELFRTLPRTASMQEVAETVLEALGVA
jgi:hypothetical protein